MKSCWPDMIEVAFPGYEGYPAYYGGKAVVTRSAPNTSS
jgi:hypothetical protein